MTGFDDALARNRERLNALFGQATLRTPQLDPAAFLDHLQEVIGPAVQAVHEVQPQGVDAVLDTLFTASLDLMGRGLTGPGGRIPTIDEAWRTLWRAHPLHLAAAPQRVVAAITNAVTHLGDGTARWLSAMERAGHVAADADVWLQTGQVLGWSCGLTRLRHSALALCRTLPPDLAAIALHEEAIDDVAAACDALLHHPWCAPTASATRLAWVACVGGFTGFDGPFSKPPRVSAEEGHILAHGGGATLTLQADRFGAQLLRSAPPQQASAGGSAAFEIDPSGAIRRGDLHTQIPQLAGASSTASDHATLAVTLPHSHVVHLVGIVGG